MMVENYIECIFVKIKWKNQSYMTEDVYRSPNSNFVEFKNVMFYILEN